MDKLIEPILLEKKLESPWAFCLGVIIVLCGLGYLQVSGTWSGMSSLHWGATVLICSAVFFSPVLNAGRTVRFKTDEFGIHFDPFYDPKPVSIDWNNIQNIRLLQDDGWTISIYLKSDGKIANFWTCNNVLISNDYGMPLDKLFDLLVASHEKYKH